MAVWAALSCRTCAAPWLARVFDREGQADSARIYYEQFVEMPAEDVWYDAPHLAHSYIRLGQLFEEMGNPEKASHYFHLFLDLWAEADPVLQPQIEEVRRTVERLEAGRPGSEGNTG